MTNREAVFTVLDKVHADEMFGGAKRPDVCGRSQELRNAFNECLTKGLIYKDTTWVGTANWARNLSGIYYFLTLEGKTVFKELLKEKEQATTQKLIANLGI